MSELSIILCTYNGERFLREQLDSFCAQSYFDWDLVVSDDCSIDTTLEIVSTHAVNGSHAVKVIQGPKRGFAFNFFYALNHSNPLTSYFAFSDQDDVWLPQKLEVAVNWLSEQPKDVPAMYCGATELVDQDGVAYNPPQYFGRARGQLKFSSAIVQPITSGNTMVLNRSARDLLLSCKGLELIPYHDWWCHLLVLGAGGKVFFDPIPYIKYRQHSSNTIGAVHGLKAFYSKLKNFCSLQFKNNVVSNVNCLKLNAHLLSDSNKQVLFQFERALQGPLSSRYIALYRSGVRRQGWTNLALWLGPLFNFF